MSPSHLAIDDIARSESFHSHPTARLLLQESGPSSEALVTLLVLTPGYPRINYV